MLMSFTHLKSFSGARFVSFPVLAPIHKATVFLLFSWRSEISLKRSNICKEVVKETVDPSKMSVVSSAYWLILISCSLIVMRLMFSFFQIVSAKISAKVVSHIGLILTFH